MKRYLAFFGDRQYSNVGMEDFISDHDNFKDAMEALRLAKEGYRKRFFSSIWNHVYDTVERRIVSYGLP